MIDVACCTYDPNGRWSKSRSAPEYEAQHGGLDPAVRDELAALRVRAFVAWRIVDAVPPMPSATDSPRG